MPNLAVSYNYVSYGGGGSHSRRPRGPAAGFTTLESDPGTGQYTPGDQYTVPLHAMGPTFSQNNVTYTFAFVYVSGGVGPQQNNPSTNYLEAPTVTFGTTSLEVLVVYLPPSGGQTNKPDFGASIDAFDTTSNSLVNDIFVTVSPDNRGGSVTNDANVNGWVDTTANAETIAALPQIAPTGDFPSQVTASFDKWIELGSQQSPPAGLDFIAAEGTDYVALAVYTEPPSPPPNPCEISWQPSTRI